MLPLLLAVALACSGCGSDAPVASVEDEHSLPLAEWTDKPVIAKTIINSGLATVYNGMELSSQSSESLRLLEQRNYDYNIVCVGPLAGENELSPWIVPQHEGNVIMWTSTTDAGYLADEHYLYWMEMPALAGDTHDRWYLYMRERPEQGGTLAEPVRVAEGPVPAGEEVRRITQFYCDWTAQDGVVLWAQPGDNEKEFIIRTYRADTGKTQELGRFTADEQAWGDRVDVALGENDAIWTEYMTLPEQDPEAHLKRCDLKTGKVTELDAERYMEDPVVTGDYLIMQARTKANGVTEDIMDLDGDGDKEELISAPNELWVYSLKENAWKYRINSDLPVFENPMTYEHPMVIDDAHIALVAKGAYDTYQLPAVDLTTGKIYALERAPKDPLYVKTTDCSEDAIWVEEKELLTYIRPLTRGETTNQVGMIHYNTQTEQLENVLYSMEFLW